MIAKCRCISVSFYAMVSAMTLQAKSRVSSRTRQKRGATAEHAASSEPLPTYHTKQSMDRCIDSDDIVYALAAFLPPKDLVNLALTCKSFGGAASKKKKSWSRIEEVARRQVSAAKDDVKFKWRQSDLLTIEGQESWIAVYNRLHLLRTSTISYFIHSSIMT